MARGWESKSVEQQQDEKIAEATSTRPRLTAAQQESNRRRDGLLLSRKRLVGQLETTRHPAHRKMLEESIAELDRQLASFQ
jgi:hypothetical protein